MDQGLDGLRLHKEKFYCQVCRKQCRDVNAFRCHSATPGHISRLKEFAEDPQSAIQNFSDQFLESFLEYVKVRFRNQESNLRTVYKRFIANPRHIHVTNTRFRTFDRLLNYLELRHPELNIQSGTPDFHYKGQHKQPGLPSENKIILKQKTVTPSVQQASQTKADLFSNGQVSVRLDLSHSNIIGRRPAVESGIDFEVQKRAADPEPPRKKKNLLELLNISRAKR